MHVREAVLTSLESKGEAFVINAHLLQDRSAQNEALAEPSPPQGVIRCSTLDQRRTAQRVRYDVECLERGAILPHADQEEGIISDDLDQSGTSFLAFDGVLAIGMMRVNFDADGDAAITASALRDAYRTKDLLEQFIKALATFAQASGARTLTAPQTVEDAGILAPHGFQKVRGSKDMVLRLEPPI